MTITLNPLSTSSIQDAIDKIEDYKEKLHDKRKRIIERLVEIGVEKAREMIAELGAVDTGLTLESISGEVTEDNRGIIRCASPYGAYIEFGTGTRGKEAPYPGGAEIMAGATPYTGYNSGPHVIKLPDGRVAWFYGATFTEGMPSRPFMWLTALYLEEIAPQIVKEVFSNG